MPAESAAPADGVTGRLRDVADGGDHVAETVLDRVDGGSLRQMAHPEPRRRQGERLQAVLQHGEPRHAARVEVRRDRVVESGRDRRAAREDRRAVEADFDLDGDPDAIVVGFSVACLRNDGGGRFFEASALRWGGPAVGLFDTGLGDFDGDGDLDLAVSGQLTSNPRWLVNHTRQLCSEASVHVGGTLGLDVHSGPGYAQPAVLPLLASLGVPATLLRLPGIAGALDLDLASATLVRLIGNSMIGRSRVFLPVPADNGLVGLEVFLQAGYLPSGGATFAPAFGNPIREIVLP